MFGMSQAQHVSSLKHVACQFGAHHSSSPFLSLYKTTKECSFLLLSPTAEAEKTPANPDTESAAPEATPDKPKEDVAEPSPLVARELTMDDEGADSNETSVESLKETNANNSNSRGLIERGLLFELANV